MAKYDETPAASEDRDVVRDAKERMDYCIQWESENREQAEEDKRFAWGEQWPEEVLTEREEDDRPCLVLNKSQLYTRQVANDIRQSRPGIKCRGVDSGSDPDTAEVMDGLIRAIEADSNAESAYDWAVQDAVESGWGYWEIDTEYENAYSFNQILKIRRIRNQFTVYIDPASKAQDARDMRYAFKLEKISRKEYDRRFPNDPAPAEWEVYASAGHDQEWWFSEDNVRLAEYWEVEETPITIYQLSDGSVVDQLPPDDILSAMGLVVMAERESTYRRVVYRLMTGYKVLEETEWPGRYIPIVRTLGRERDIEGKVRLKGMIRDLRDPARMYNYMRSSAVERIALDPLAPWVGPEQAFRDPKWKTANRKKHAYLEYAVEPVLEAGGTPPQRVSPPVTSPAILQEIQNASSELQSITGIFDAGVGARSNEVSGIAINSRRGESDVANFDFVDNFAKALTYSGMILVDLIPKIYTGERIVTILGADKSQDQVPINQDFVDQKTMKGRRVDFSAGRYDVVVDTGPSYATQREEAATAMLEMVKAFASIGPEGAKASMLMADVMAKNFDWPGADEIAKRLQTLLPPEVLAGENPQFAMALQQKDQQLQQGQQQLEQMAQIIQSLQMQLQDKQHDQQIAEGDLARKVQEAVNDHVEKMTKLELDANRDLSQAGVAY